MTRSIVDSACRPTPTHAMKAPPEQLAYVALDANGASGKRDAIGVIDTRPGSPSFGRCVGEVSLPGVANEVRRIGWNTSGACAISSSARGGVDARFLIVPGTRSSRIHILDTWPDPQRPQLVRVIEGEEVIRRTGYAAPHTVRSGPEGIFISALGAPDGNAPGGIFTLDHTTFEIQGAWESDRGPQCLAHDFSWISGEDVMITSEWATPNILSPGLDPELLFAGRYGHALHEWDLGTRRHRRRIDLGTEQQLAMELRPAHAPGRTYGFVGVMTSRVDLSSSVFVWYLDRTAGGGRGEWKARKVISIPAERADASALPPFLQGAGVVPPLVSDIHLSLDDRWLYVSCWGTGELRQYEVTDPFHPLLVGMVRIGGIVRRSAHPGAPRRPLSGGPQRVEVSRDGRRIYLTNALHAAWDAQFYPDGIRAWMVKVDALREGGIVLDPEFMVEFEDGRTAHQVRLEGGDASS